MQCALAGRSIESKAEDGRLVTGSGWRLAPTRRPSGARGTTMRVALLTVIKWVLAAIVLLLPAIFIVATIMKATK